MAPRRPIFVFLLICASCPAAVLYLRWTAEVQRDVALAAIDAMHGQQREGQLLDRDPLEQVRTPIGAVEGFWPLYSLVETSNPFQTVVYIKGLTSFANGSASERFRWRVEWWHRAVLEEYEIDWSNVKLEDLHYR